MISSHSTSDQMKLGPAKFRDLKGISRFRLLAQSAILIRGLNFRCDQYKAPVEIGYKDLGCVLETPILASEHLRQDNDNILAYNFYQNCKSLRQFGSSSLF